MFSPRTPFSLGTLSVLLLAATVGLAGCDSSGSANDDGGVDVTITVNNIGAEAYEVTNVQGATGVAQTGTNNPTLTLTVGTRYRVDNNGGIDAHPFGLQNANDDYLLRQESGETGSLENNDAINYQEDDEGVTFTYTSELANAVNNYRCTFHPAMEGAVQSGN
jgi:hypothetical protein